LECKITYDDSAFNNRRQKKATYYCKTCDIVFASKRNISKHLDSVKHKNLILAIDAQKTTDEKYKNMVIT